MFTKNWYKIIGALMSNRTSTSEGYITYNGSTHKYGDVNNAVASCLRIAYNYDGYVYPTIHKMRTSLNTYSGVIIGTGTTAPTIDDYCLSGSLITTFTHSSTVTTSEDEYGCTVTATYTITNTGANAFTVGEIGLIFNAYINNDSSSSTKGLLERTVLDSPITIEAGGVGQITYTIRMDYPTA